MQIGLRYTFTLPLAALATAGLFLGMKALISADFKPQKKIAATTFEIHPEIIDIKPAERVTKLASLNKIDVPPAPPEIERAKATQPEEPITKVGDDIPPLNPGGIKFDPINFQESDREATPTVRIAAVMPPRAQKSGHCKVRFDVSPDGNTYNIQTTYCSERIFERPTIRSVAKWKYNPKIRDGIAVARTGVESVMSFNLKDDSGNIIPE